MASDGEFSGKQSVEQLPSQRKTSITEELNGILVMLKAGCPENAIISFDFDGQLRVHIDVHSMEDLLRVEGLLPALGAGIFHDLMRGDTPHHRFSHRLTAIVDR